jgi:protein SCO1/2
MSPRLSRLLLLVTAFAAGLFACLLVILLITGPGNSPIAQVGAPPIGGPFRLVDQDGKAVTEQDLQGRPSLLFFGFTNCPDICPTALFEMSEVLNRLGNDAEKVNAVFVTVDPERDRPEVMKDYLSNFNPRLRGFTGDPTDLTAMLKSYRVYWRKVPQPNGEYTMDHSAAVYLMDKQVHFIAPFSLKRKPEDAAADLRRYL